MNAQLSIAHQYAQHNDWQFQRGLDLIKVANVSTGDIVLDIGCGTGELSLEIAKIVGPSGRVIAIDCDQSRIEVAKRNQPEAYQNIEYLVCDAQELNEISSQSIDLIFSNYVFHWINDKHNLLMEMYRCLKKDGRFAIECVGELMPFLQQVTEISGRKGDQLLKKFHCLEQEEWQQLLIKNNFNSVVNWCEHNYYFEDIIQFFDWWEATTHGEFLRSNICDFALKDLEKLFSGCVEFSGYSSQCLGKKIEHINE